MSFTTAVVVIAWSSSRAKRGHSPRWWSNNSTLRLRRLSGTRLHPDVCCYCCCYSTRQGVAGVRGWRSVAVGWMRYTSHDLVSLSVSVSSQGFYHLSSSALDRVCGLKGTFDYGQAEVDQRLNGRHTAERPRVEFEYEVATNDSMLSLIRRRCYWGNAARWSRKD